MRESSAGSPPDPERPSSDNAWTIRSTVPSVPPEPPPDSIGPYKILRKLGEGGMGEVYEAWQQEPVRRRVALKLIKVGMDTRQVVARFEGERQALARMEHPNIARVFDAGATEAGRPFFAMEYVPGVPITRYCDTQRMDTAARLRLFIQVCRGVQHAHQKGIIHRDVKPSNVLVTLQDDRPVPKIIDFGVAKATQEPLTDQTLRTAVGHVVGTIEYMSPEQAEGTGLDIDTRTDVYALGVLLYELLVGVLPFESRTLRRAAADEIRRVIREEEPPRPSTRLISSGPASTETARRRKADVASLARQLRGDLDWITMKALEKDRTRRYASAADMAADVERHLRNEPVLASPPSALYRARKFVRRHRTGVVAGATVFGALCVGIVGTTVGMIRAHRAERVAREQADTATQIADFLEEMFRLSDPNQLRANTITAREILDEGTRRIERDLTGQPAVQARLLARVGGVYRNLGLLDEAAPLLERSLEIRRELFGEDDPEVAHSLHELAWLAWSRGDYEKALSLAERSVAIREKTLEPDDLDLAEGLHTVGLIRWSAGDFAGAREPIERALAIRERKLGPDHPDVADCLNSLGALYYRMDDYAGARELWERALSIREKSLGPDHPFVAATLSNLAVVLTETGDYAGAMPLLKRAIAIQEKALGPDHPDLASGLNNLGELLMGMDDLEGARPLYERAIAIQERAAGPDHPELARYLANLARVERLAGNLTTARQLAQRSLAIREKALDPGHTDIAWGEYGLGMIEVDEAEYESAESRFERAKGIFDRALGADSPSVGWCFWGMARVHAGQGRHEQAQQEFERAIQLMSETGQGTIGLARLLDDYARERHEAGRQDEERALQARAAAIRARYAP